MTERHVIIVGGGLAGLSAGCYARASGFRTTIIEHNLALGGVCTAWNRGPYTIDGCIHWLTGGAFQRLYEELGIVPRVPLRTMEQFLTYRDARDGLEVTISRDLEATARALRELAPEDADEIRRLVDGADRVVNAAPPIDQPVELATMRDQLASFWNMRHDLGTIAHFRKPIGEWSAEHLKSERLRRVLTRIVPEDATTLVLLMVLGYLKHGYLSRPEGGTARFRDALIDTYRRRGGEAILHSTVDEVLVDGDRACGGRLAAGSVHSGRAAGRGTAPDPAVPHGRRRGDGDDQDQDEAAHHAAARPGRRPSLAHRHAAHDARATGVAAALPRRGRRLQEPVRAQEAVRRRRHRHRPHEARVAEGHAPDVPGPRKGSRGQGHRDPSHQRPRDGDDAAPLQLGRGGGEADRHRQGHRVGGGPQDPPGDGDVTPRWCAWWCAWPQKQKSRPALSAAALEFPLIFCRRDRFRTYDPYRVNAAILATTEFLTLPPQSFPIVGIL